ncbi:hypothetical protein ACSBR2_025196 [Camellia fascicularis]
MDLRANGSHGGDGLEAQRDWTQIKVPGLCQSMSMSDPLNHIGHCISERMAFRNIHHDGLDDRKHIQAFESMHENTAASMSRKNSFGDLLLSLPRITSLPKFLFDILEDDANQDR